MGTTDHEPPDEEPGLHEDEPGLTDDAEIAEIVELFQSSYPKDDPLPPHSWTPVDLVAHDQTPPSPPTIGGIVYPGRRHLFSGEPESLKSWAAMVLCVEQIRHDQPQTVAYIDFEMGARETLSRLRDIGLTDHELTNHFIYIEPDQAFFDPEIVQDTNQLLIQRQPNLIIIDAFTGALQVHQLDPNKSTDIERFYRKVIDPLRRHGAAVVVLDHLPKDPLNRGKFAIGSERKVGAAEVHLGFETLVPFGRGRVGRAKITTHKDRPGYLPRPRTAELELRSTDEGITWTWHEPAREQDPDNPVAFRPTMLMERVSRFLELQHEPSSLTTIETCVKGRAEWVRAGLEILVADGYIHETIGPRRARLFERIKDYRDEPDDSVPLRPDPVPDGVSDSVPPRTPPLKGGDGVTTREDGVQHSLDSVPPTNPDNDIPF